MEKLILFDFDGTLADTGEGITRSAQYALDQMGWPHYDPGQLGFFVGPPLNDSFMHLGMTEDQALQGVRWFRKRYESIGKFESSVYPGIPEMLQALKKKGLSIGMATSKPEQFAREIARRCGFLKWFDYVCGISLVETEQSISKTQLIGSVLTRSGYQDHRELVCMVGDRKFDITGAKECGIGSVGVTYGYGDREELVQAGADVILDSVRELTDFLLTL
ncbi:MAG: HAD hydrolase-like protein [Bilifractor sp.]